MSKRRKRKPVAPRNAPAEGFATKTFKVTLIHNVSYTTKRGPDGLPCSVCEEHKDYIKGLFLANYTIRGIYEKLKDEKAFTSAINAVQRFVAKMRDEWEQKPTTPSIHAGK